MAEFQGILNKNFHRKIKYGKFKKILVKRLFSFGILLVIAILIQGQELVLEEEFGIFLIFSIFLYFIDAATCILILFKFTFYTDLLCIHLKAISEILGRSRKKFEILTVKKLYVVNLEMSREVENFMRITMQNFIIEMIFWLLISTYRAIEVQFELFDRVFELGEKI